MHNNDERLAVTAGLACLCGVGAVTAIVPVAGYVLLGLVGLGIVGLIAAGLAALWQTRPAQDDHRLSQVSRMSTVPAHSTRSEVA